MTVIVRKYLNLNNNKWNIDKLQMPYEEHHSCYDILDGFTMIDHTLLPKLMLWFRSCIRIQCILLLRFSNTNEMNPLFSCISLVQTPISSDFYSIQSIQCNASISFRHIQPTLSFPMESIYNASDFSMSQWNTSVFSHTDYIIISE